MSELLKKQRFGVEVEFTGITRKMAADAVAEILGHRASAPAGCPYYTRKIKDRAGREWKVMRDSSIEPKRKVGEEKMDEYRVEFVTPPLNYEDIETLQTIIRKFREIGGIADKSCGIHIHVDGANHNADSLKRLVNFMVARQDLIYDALNNNDRKGRWCRPISPELLTALKKEGNLTIAKTEQIWYSPDNDGYLNGIDHSHYNPTRYHGLYAQ